MSRSNKQRNRNRKEAQKKKKEWKSCLLLFHVAWLVGHDPPRLPNWPSRSQLIDFRFDNATFLLLWQVDERQLDHSEEVIARKAILIKHLKHQFVFVGLHAKDELLVPVGVESLKEKERLEGD
jgi:hypothetical protein